MNSDIDVKTLAGRTVHGKDGKIGKVVDVYESTDERNPTFVTVATGMFGSKSSFVPLNEAQMQGEDVAVPYEKALVKDAPQVEADEELASEEEERLYKHYNLLGADAGAPAPTGQDTSGESTDQAMTRSEEQLAVGTQQVEAGRARLRKRVVTEQQTVNVPVTKEKVVLEREPITEGNVGDAKDGPAISEAEHEVVLTEERPVVQKETVPVERVQLGKEAVTQETAVTEEVRKEHIETDGVPKKDS